jgi:hypothetical protein
MRTFEESLLLATSPFPLYNQVSFSFVPEKENQDAWRLLVYGENGSV